MADQAAALANVVVLNLMRGEAGATTSFYLAQLGARVILVEPLFGAPQRAQAQALPHGEAFWSPGTRIRNRSPSTSTLLPARSW